MPRALGGTDELSNLITLCDGCHAAHHPNLQVKLSRRLIERWSLGLVRWLDSKGETARAATNLSPALRLFGLTRFRDGQLPVVLAALAGRSVLLVSPTGSGKSLCFQLDREEKAARYQLLENGVEVALAYQDLGQPSDGVGQSWAGNLGKPRQSRLFH